MNDNKIPVRYARALFESASEKEILDDIMKDMVVLQEVCTLPEFQYLINTPVIRVSLKSEMMALALAKGVHELTRALLDLLIRNGRERYIRGIARNFIESYRIHMGIRSATLTSAVAMTEEIRKNVEKVIQEALGHPVQLDTGLDKELIGGFVIRIDDLQYDASVASSLNKVKQTLLN
ncbi:MAG: ATP synthase F1 subunit delta [Bacteroidales bacterium]|nr:ATP synthase F1 subunit delta [Bacteroidales bacterium]